MPDLHNNNGMSSAMSLARRLKPPHLRLVLKIAETGQLQIAATALRSLPDTLHVSSIA